MEASAEQQLQALIDQFVTHKTFDEAYTSFSPAQLQSFLESYYLAENLNYEAELKTRREDGLALIDEAIGKYRDNGALTPELVDGILLISKTVAIDAMIGKVQAVHESLRSKLKDKDIKDFMTTMTFQMGMGALVMEYNEALGDEMERSCKDRKIDVEAFMREAVPLLTGDMSIFFEIDNFYGLKVYDKLKGESVSQAQVEDYIKRTTQYSKMVTGGELNPQTLIVFPSLINHYLYNETGLENVQVLDFVMKKVREGQTGNEGFFRNLFEEIYYIERGRRTIMDVFQAQMQMMNQMMGGSDVGDGSQVFQPNWNAGPELGAHPQGMDQILMNSNFESQNSTGVPDMEAMAHMMENLDFAKIAEMFPEMEQMMKQFAGGMPKPDEEEKE